MGKIARYKFLTFFVVSFDLFKEPAHVHIIKERGNFSNPAKLWLETLEWAEIGDLSEKDQIAAFKIVKEKSINNDNFIQQNERRRKSKIYCNQITWKVFLI